MNKLVIIVLIFIIFLFFAAFLIKLTHYNMGYKSGLQQGASDTRDGRAYCPGKGYGFSMKVFFMPKGVANSEIINAGNFNKGYKKGYDEDYNIEEAKKAFLKNEERAILVNYFTCSYTNLDLKKTLEEKTKEILGSHYDGIYIVKHSIPGINTKTGITMNLVKGWFGPPSEQSEIHSKELKILKWSYFFPGNENITFTFWNDDLRDIDASDKFSYLCRCFGECDPFKSAYGKSPFEKPASSPVKAAGKPVEASGKKKIPSEEMPIYGTSREQEQVKKEFSQVRRWSQTDKVSHRAFRERCEELEEITKKIKVGVTTEKDIIEWFGNSGFKMEEFGEDNNREGFGRNQKILVHSIRWMSGPLDSSFRYSRDSNYCTLTVSTDRLTAVVVDYFIEYSFIPFEMIGSGHYR